MESGKKVLLLKSRDGHSLCAGFLGDRSSCQPETLASGGKIKQKLIQIVPELRKTIRSPSASIHLNPEGPSPDHLQPYLLMSQMLDPTRRISIFLRPNLISISSVQGWFSAGETRLMNLKMTFVLVSLF